MASPRQQRINTEIKGVTPDYLKSTLFSANESRLSHLSALDIYNDPHAHRKSSIICTIGPDTNSPEVLLEMAKTGMNIVRLNFSHGSYEVRRN